MLDIVAAAHYYHALAEQPQLPALRELVNAVCRERPRRIDRYTELALLGSARCVAGRQLAPDTGLYLGSRFASLGNIIAVHRQMISCGETPKPANFINSLSNSAGYYVARNLGLQQRNLFVSRADASLVAALQLAELDLAAKAVSAALVGIVEEGVLPQAEHCQRLGVAEDTALAEGSHWLLVAPSDSRETAGEPRLGQLDNIRTLPDAAALQRWLAEMRAAGDCQLYAPAPTRAQWAEQLAAIAPFAPALAYYPAVAAAALLEFLMGDSAERAANLLCVIADGEQRFHVLRARRSAD